MTGYIDCRLWVCPRCGDAWPAPATVTQAVCYCPSLYQRRYADPPRRKTLMTDITLRQATLMDPGFKGPRFRVIPDSTVFGWKAAL